MTPTDPISKYFTWKDALWLPKWNRMANESDGLTPQVLSNLKLLFDKMDIVRDFIQRPIIVHCAYRPLLYNQAIRGAKDSAHMALEPGVAAVDFNVRGMNCMPAKMEFLPMLEVWNMRLEKNGIDANWLHLDIGRTGKRYFNP